VTLALPPDLAAALDRATWPDAAEARGLLTRGVRGDTRVALVRWAFDAARPSDGAAPTQAAWAAMLGVRRATLVGERGLWRRCAPDLVPASDTPGPARKPDDEIAPESARKRESSDRRKGQPKQTARERQAAAQKRREKEEAAKRKAAEKREAAARLRAVVVQRAAERAAKRQRKTATA
jgi:hypothetical protein